MPPRDPRRQDRVAEAVREEIAAFLSHGLKDPRVTGLLTVTAVEMTRDLRHATVYVSVLGTEAEKSTALEVLGGVAGHLRSRVGKALRLQFAPEIQFRPDESVARAARIETLLASLHQPPAADAAPEDDRDD